MHKPTMSALAALALSLSLASTASAKGTATAKVRLAKDLPNQAVDLMRPYLTSGSKLAKGDLYLQLCDDAACAKVKSSHKVVNYMFSSGFPKDVSVADLPDGTFYARFGLDTQYSQDYAGGFDAEKGFGPYDLLQSEGADPRPKLGDNLTPATKKITIANGATVDLGEAVLGTLLTTNPAFAPSKESGWLLSAASGDGSYRNHLKALDLDTYQLAAPAIAKLDGADFKGDLCGIIPGKGSEAFVVGVGNEGAYVFSYDTKKRAFASGKPVKIPHPDCKDGKCPAQPSAVSYPWMCRGSFAEKGGKSLLFLHDYKGAGAQTTVNGYHAAVVDVTGLATGGGGLVATYGVGAEPFLSPKRLFRGAGVIGDTLYLLEPSWSEALADDKAPKKNHVHAIPIQADGKLNFAARKSFTAEASDDTCGATNNAVPGLTIQAFGGGPKLFVGNDDAITIHDPSGKQTGSIDTRNYGTLVTSFALAPDG